jgi:hypothetical protein
MRVKAIGDFKNKKIENGRIYNMVSLNNGTLASVPHHPIGIILFIEVSGKLLRCEYLSVDQFNGYWRIIK